MKRDELEAIRARTERVLDVAPGGPSSAHTVISVRSETGLRMHAVPNAVGELIHTMRRDLRILIEAVCHPKE